jgi:hypothetical protein
MAISYQRFESDLYLQMASFVHEAGCTVVTHETTVLMGSNHDVIVFELRQNGYGAPAAAWLLLALSSAKWEQYP